MTTAELEAALLASNAECARLREDRKALMEGSIAATNALREERDKLKTDLIEARNFIDKIGFYCAGTEFNHIADRVLEFFAANPGAALNPERSET